MSHSGGKFTTSYNLIKNQSKSTQVGISNFKNILDNILSKIIVAKSNLNFSDKFLFFGKSPPNLSKIKYPCRKKVNFQPCQVVTNFMDRVSSVVE